LKTVTDQNTASTHAHLAAVTKLLLGQTVLKTSVAITAGGPLDQPQKRRIASMAFLSETDVIHLEFATNDAGRFGLVGMCIFMPRDNACHLYNDCQLWLGEGKSRALILPLSAARGHFRLAPRELIHIDGKPCAAPEEGIARAHARIGELMQHGVCVKRQVMIEDISPRH
jgi:hypothetical protein